MNKTISINLGGTIFNIDDAAFEKLRDYLDSIKNHFANETGNEEIINDIEMRAAEEFAGKITGAKKVITIDDIEDLIKTMGTIADIAEGASQDSPESKPTKEGRHRRLYRNTDDVVIAGVCSGIAAYFGIDPVIIRILFVLSIFVAGSSIFFYIILWIIMPEAKSTTEKMQMRGEPITISSLEEAVKNKFKSNPEERKKILRVLSVPFRFVGQIFSLVGRLARKIIPVISVLAGLAASILFLVGFGFSLFAFANLLFNANSPYIDFPFKSFVFGLEYYGLLAAGLLIIVIPLMFILLTGISLIRRKSSFGLISSLSLIMLWIVSIISVSVIAIKTAPEITKWRNDKITDIETRKIEVPTFNKISVRGDFKIDITKATSSEVIASGQRELFNQTNFEVVDGTLKIKKIDQDKLCILCTTNFLQPLTIKISAPSITSYASGGDANANMSGFDDSDFKLELYNRSNFSGNVSAKTINAIIENDSSAVLAGASTYLFGKLEDSAELDCRNLATEKAEIEAKNSSKTTLGQTKEISYGLENYSRIYYQGTPIITTKKSLSPKMIRSKDDEEQDVEGEESAENMITSENY